MLSEISQKPLKQFSGLQVLILVLMEYALWDLIWEEFVERAQVLILVLMEYALWDNYAIFASSMPASS